MLCFELSKNGTAPGLQTIELGENAHLTGMSVSFVEGMMEVGQIPIHSLRAYCMEVG